VQTEKEKNKPGDDRVHLCVMGLTWCTGVVHVGCWPWAVGDGGVAGMKTIGASGCVGATLIDAGGGGILHRD
jgi:hypothetical protein